MAILPYTCSKEYNVALGFTKTNMDFLDPKKKRAHNRRLFVGYVLMAVTIFMISILLLFATYGYNIDPRTGVITQSGLVFIDSHLESAAVKINGQAKGDTSQRLVLPAGNYSVELSRDGYRQWKKSFSLDGGTIERLVYPFIFPTELKTADLQLYAAEPTLATQSPDRRWLITQQPNNIQQLDLYDLLTDVPTAAPLALPSDLLTKTGTNHKLEEVEWSTDNRHVVLKHSLDGGSELILIDREAPANSRNLNKVFNQNDFEVTLLDKKFDRYYLFNRASGQLSTAELQNGRITPFLDGVLEFSSHGDDVVVFASSKGASEGNVKVNIRQNNRDYSLRELPKGPKYLLNIARFDGKWLVAAGVSSDQRVYVYKNPVDLLDAVPLRKLVPATTLRIDQPQYVSFSGNARFIAVQSGSRFAIYDAETSRSYRYDTALTLPDNYEAKWMDGHRISVVSQQKINVFDFDGLNLQTLSASGDKFMAFFHRDYEALFTIGPSSSVSGRTALMRTELKVTPGN